MVYTEEELWVGRTVWLWILSAVMERNVERNKNTNRHNRKGLKNKTSDFRYKHMCTRTNTLSDKRQTRTER